MASSNKKDTKESKAKSDNIFKRTLQGRIISSSFFKKHWLGIIWVLALFLAFIANKYHCQTQQEQIKKLTTELNNAKTERVKFCAEYSSKIRETRMRKLIDTLNLTIVMPEQPPFKLNPDETTK